MLNIRFSPVVCVHTESEIRLHGIAACCTALLLCMCPFREAYATPTLMCPLILYATYEMT